MKILHIISSLRKEDGGLPVSVKNLSHELNINNISSDIATTYSKNKNIKVDKNTKTRVYKFKRFFFDSIQFSIELKKFLDLKLSQYDLVHIHGLYRFPTSYAAYKARKLKIPYIISTHGSLDPYLYKQSKKNLFLKRLWERLIDFPILKKANGIHCTSDIEKRKIKKLNLNKRIFTIPIFISNIFFKKKKQKTKKFRKINGLNDNEFVILFIEKLNFKKGLDLLIPAFNKINKKFKKTKLLIVGPNPDKYLENVVKPLIKKYKLSRQINYIKPQYHKNLVACYENSNLFVLPSYTENFGLTIFEAMSQNVPVVVSDQVDLAPVIKKNNLARICKCNTDSLVEKIFEVLKNKKKNRTIKKRAYKFVKDNYSSSIVVKQIIETYKLILNN